LEEISVSKNRNKRGGSSKGEVTMRLSLTFSDIAELLDGGPIEVLGSGDEVVSLKIKQYRTDPEGVEEVQEVLEDNFGDGVDEDDDDDDDDDVQDPDDYEEDDEDEEEDEDEDDDKTVDEDEV
jgi:hypothetical protein